MTIRNFILIASIVLLILPGCKGNEERFFEALHNDDYTEARRLLESGELDVNARNTFGYTPLHLSVDVAVTELLIAAGADPNAAGGGVDPGLKPLKNIDLGKLGTFDLNELKRGKDYSPLHTVESDKVAEVLLAHGGDVNARANYQVTPLHRAAGRMGGLKLAKLLLDQGANVDARTNYNKTPLHEAMFYAKQNNGEIVKLLIERGANVNAQDNLGHTPLHGIRNGNVALASLLVEQGADVTLESSSGDLPICYAIGDNQIELMHFYIVKGEGILSRCSADRSLLEYADQKASARMVNAVKDATVLILQEFQKSLDVAK
jgi:ankyrin repeat protein